MATVSILMSVFNESEDQIRNAVESILNQSYKDFELIIVNDAPFDNSLKSYMKKIEQMDNRITVIDNPENIGLALSMNKAVAHSSGKYLARMDADDISLPSRLEKEVNLLKSGECDFVFTGYEYIDDQGNAIFQNRKYRWYSDDQIGEALMQDNIIHHPTVMFTRNIFEKTAGYRAFPCAQDYDLWLRLVDVSCRFHMIDESLLKYRVRNTSITSKKSLQQKWTIEYSRELFVERLRKGCDSFSVEHYRNHIDSMHLKYRNAEKNFKQAGQNLMKAKEYREKNQLVRCYAKRVFVFLTNKIYRDSYLRKMKNLKEIKYLQSHKLEVNNGSVYDK